jgi:hypothetical protein
MKPTSETITITFGECGENHVGMQKLGTRASEGFTRSELNLLKEGCEAEGFKCELHDLSAMLPKEHQSPTLDACVLVIRGACGVFGLNADATFEKLKAIEWDQHMWNKGVVTKKIATHNICFDMLRQEPDYPQKKGRIVHFKDVPDLLQMREGIHRLFGDKAANFIAEGNRYYDVKKCGIGWHGDAERKMVAAIRFGAPMSLAYQWYLQCGSISDKLTMTLNHGDVYFMSEKATGWDWRTQKIPTLRHAAGCQKYVGAL